MILSKKFYGLGASFMRNFEQCHIRFKDTDAEERWQIFSFVLISIFLILFVVLSLSDCPSFLALSYIFFNEDGGSQRVDPEGI